MRQNAQERMKSFASKAQEAAGESETAKQAREKAGQAAERLKEGLKDSETAKQAQEQFSSFRSKLGESTEKLFEANPLLKKGAERLKKQQDDLKGSEKVQGAFTVIQESIQEARDDLMGRKTMKQREEAAKAAVEAKRAEEEAAAAAAGPWKAFKDEETGDTYYYNSETEETQWEVPEGLKTRSGEDGGAGGDAAAGDGPSELVLVKDDSASTWERIRERMRRTPLISDILGAAGKAGAQFQQSSAGQNAAKARDRVEDFTEDFRERWETSQNPWVYSLASAWDGITAETEEAACVKEMRRLDPSWDEWQFLQVRQFSGCFAFWVLRAVLCCALFPSFSFFLLLFLLLHHHHQFPPPQHPTAAFTRVTAKANTPCLRSALLAAKSNVKLLVDSEGICLMTLRRGEIYDTHSSSSPCLLVSASFIIYCYGPAVATIPP